MSVLPPTSPPPARRHGGLRVAAPQDTQTEQGLRLILGHAGRPAADSAVVDFLRYAIARRIDLSQMRVAEIDGRIVWATLPIVSPGRTALLLCPDTPPAELGDAAECLRATCAAAFAGGTRLAQVLCEPDARGLRQVAADAGFGPLAELIYLSRAVPRWPASEDGRQWVPYNAARHELFRDVIRDSYAGSLDCPELNAVREMDDVLADHRAAGDFWPDAWELLLGGDGRPLGVVLVNGLPGQRAGELVYVGLTEAARGRRLGEVLGRRALWLCRRHGLDSLILAADARNAPALRTYARLGFVEVARKLALMRTA